MADDEKSSPAKMRKSKTKRKLQEMNQLQLLMSGLKTEKEKLLAKHLGAQIKKTNDKESELKSLNTKLKQVEAKLSKTESTSKKARDMVYKEQKLRTSAISDQHRIKAAMSKIQKAVSARLKLLGIDFANITSIGEALDASLKAINSLIAQLQEKDEIIGKMTEEINALKAKVEKQKKKIGKLEDTVAKQKKIIEELKKKLQEKDEKIDALEKENKELKDENKSLKDELDKVKAEFAKYKKETAEKFDDMAKKILDAQEENVAKQSEIDRLLKIIEDLKNKQALQEKTMTDQSDKIKQLEDTIRDQTKELEAKDKKIEELNDEIQKLKDEIERLLAIINRPKSTTAAQTDISGAIDQQLSDYPRLLKEIVALKQLLEKKNQRIKDLEEENRLLMADLQYLLKRSVAFYSDRSSHTGQVWQMEAAPNRYLVATGSTDTTVRLWRINPEADKSKGQKMTQPIKCSRIDGKIDSLCWSQDGKLLGAGTGYRDGADGFVCVWSMEGKGQYEVVNAIRSRPTLRFGRTYALCFSPNAEYIYCGDTVGNIWCLNLESEQIVGLIQSHKDIVYDCICDPTGTSLYSVSLDKTLAVIVLPEECGGKKGARNSYLAGNDDDEKKSDDKKMPSGVKDIKRKSTKGGSKSRKSVKGKGKGGKGKGGKADKHLRKRSSSRASLEPKEQKKYSSMTLKELLDQEKDDEYKQYEGITLIKDDKYAFWRICCTKDGKSIVCATRKVQIFRITGKDSVEKGPNVSDMDMEHVRALHVRNGLILTSRMGCTRSKLFSLESGKETKNIKCKKAVAQACFLCDDSYAAILQQELVPNQAPKAPSMRLFQYNKGGKKIATEPSTPRISTKELTDDPSFPESATPTAEDQ